MKLTLSPDMTVGYAVKTAEKSTVKGWQFKEFEEFEEFEEFAALASLGFLKIRSLSGIFGDVFPVNQLLKLFARVF
ncbi:MAG: hypothetical protein ACLVHQ_04640 [Oscillospiraceae bacterium]